MGRRRRAACVMAGVALALGAAGDAARAQPAAPAAQAGPTNLYLEVSINHWPRGLVATFRVDGDKVSVSAAEFKGLGFLPQPGAAFDADGGPRVALDRAPGFSWRIDMAAQKIDIQAPFEALEPNRLAISPPPAAVRSHAEWGALIGYDIYGEWSQHTNDPLFSRYVSGDLEARLIAPSFTFSTTAAFSAGADIDASLIRLDTTLMFDRPETATTAMIGDGFSGALAWTRSIRFGGVQWRRDFGLRPDLVTEPMPQFSSGVALPSTVDLFVNGVQRYASGVDPGSLRIDDLPVATGVNSMRIVITDRAGRRREVILPFYAATQLLAPGLSDFSLEAGAERENYSLASWDYGRGFVSGSYRRGLTRWLTVEAHGEAAQGFGMVGAGAAATVGSAFLLVGAAAASSGPAGQGGAYLIGFERDGPKVSASLHYSQRSGSFQDLAALFDQPQPLRSLLGSFSWRLSDTQSVTLTYVGQDRGTAGLSEVGTAIYSKSFFRQRLRFDATAYADLAEKKDWGATLTLTLSFGGYVMSTAGVSARPHFESWNAGANGSSKDGDLNWRAQYTGGDSDILEGNIDWRGRLADLSGHVVKIGSSAALQGEIGQSLVWFDDGLFLSSRVDDAFTVVDLDGLKGVGVFLENRSVGRTSDDGRLFVNRLLGSESNSISIDAHDLPLNAQTKTFSEIAAPRRNSGVVTHFAVDRQTAAVIVLKRADGAPPPVGAELKVAGVEEPAMVGYGGEAYVRGLKAGENAVQVTWPEGSCKTSVRLPADEGGIPRLEAPPCV